MTAEQPTPRSDADYTQLLEAYVATPQEYPQDRFAGRGIVICAGGPRYFTNAYVAIRMLRRHGCNLPAQFWHLGPDEIDDEMRAIVKPYNVECVDGYEVRKQYPVRTLHGWELKSFALLHCPFEEVLFLDADNVAVRNPEYLFDTQEYQNTGAIFWPDYGRLAADRAIWRIVNVPYRDEPEFESGQIIVDKRRCWKALNVAMHFNEWSSFYYRHIHGDKETFHMAWRKLGQEYSMPRRGIHALTGTMCQHDFDGSRVFQHRNLRKWQLQGHNEHIPGFELENECLVYLEDLRSIWSKAPKTAPNLKFQEIANQIVAQRYYQYCRVGHDFRRIEMLEHGRIAAGEKAVEHTWSMIGTESDPRVAFWHNGAILADLAYKNGMLHGQWMMYEKMPIVMLPANKAAELETEMVELRKPRLHNVLPAPAGENKASDTLVLTGYFGPAFTNMSEEILPRMRAYARKYGYDFATCDLVGSRPPAWYKIPALFQALQQYARVLWLDADVLIMRDDKDIFAEFDGSSWQAMTRHDIDIGPVPNCGVWILTRALLPVLEKIWIAREFIDHPWWEQAALMVELGYPPTTVEPVRQTTVTQLATRTQLLPLTWNYLPTYFSHAAVGLDSPPRFVHFTGRGDKLQQMREYLAANG